MTELDFWPSLSVGPVCVAVPLHQGLSRQPWRVDITDGSGRLVAHGKVRLHDITAKPSGGPAGDE